MGGFASFDSVFDLSKGLTYNKVIVHMKEGIKCEKNK